MRNCEYEQYEPSQIDQKKTILEQLLVIKSMIKNNFPTPQVYLSNVRLTTELNISNISNLNGRKPKENDIVLFYTSTVFQFGFVENFNEDIITLKDIGEIGTSSGSDFNFDNISLINFISDTALEATSNGITYNGTAQVEFTDNDTQSFQFEMQVPVVGSNRISVDLNENGDKIEISMERNRLGRHFVVVSGTHEYQDSTSFSAHFNFSLLEMTTTESFLFANSYTRIKDKLSNREVYSLGANVPLSGYVKDKDDNNWHAESMFYDTETEEVKIRCYSIEFSPQTKIFSLKDLNLNYKDNIQSYNIGD